MKKQIGFKTKGMNRDLSVSAFNPEFAFENMNLRLSTNEGNTLMSWVNEKGTGDISLMIDGIKVRSLQGTVIGTAILNHYLVLFLTNCFSEGPDCIYRFAYEEDKESMTGVLLYYGNLGFQTSCPLETMVSFEGEHIQKVYWTDGKSQPRVINIVSDNILKNVDTQFDFVNTLKLEESVHVQKVLGGGGMFAPGVIQYAFTYYHKYGQESNIFYTTPLYYISHSNRGGSPEDKIDNTFKIIVENVDTNFDYLRIYSIQRTSINATPICKRIQDIDLKNSHRDMSVVSSVDTSWIPLVKIGGAYQTFTGVNTNHLYQIQMEEGSVLCIGFIKGKYPDLVVKYEDKYLTWGESSTNSSTIWISKDRIPLSTKFRIICSDNPNAAKVNLQTMFTSWYDVTSSEKKIEYIDTGLNGDSIDPMELLYKGGNGIMVGTMEQKDGTLFMGDITTPGNRVPEFPELVGSPKITVISSASDTRSFYPMVVSSQDYNYANQLSAYDDEGYSVPCAGFKQNDFYRCGIQFQDALGRWTDPIFIEDIMVEASPNISSEVSSSGSAYSRGSVAENPNVPESTGGGITPDDSSDSITPEPSPTPDPSPQPVGEGVTFVLQNNCGYEVRLSGRVTLNISTSPTNWGSSFQISADIHGPQVGSSWAYNDIIIAPGASYTWTASILSTYTSGKYYFMSTDNGEYAHSIYLYSRIWRTTKGKSEGSNHMYVVTPPQNTKLQSGMTYSLNLYWINPEASLAPDQSGHYIILEKNKQTL